MATMDVLNATGGTEAIEKPLAPGAAAAAASRPVTLSTENLAVLGAVTETAPASDTASSGLNGRLQRIAQRLTSLIGLWNAGSGTATAALRTTLASDDPAVVILARTITTVSASYTRPGDTTAYAAGDSYSNSTSAPAVLTFTSVVPTSGKGGYIVGLDIVNSNAPTLPIQGVLHLFDTTVTAVNDNSAFTISDSQMLTRVAEIPFQLRTQGANSFTSIDLAKAFTTVGSANLFGVVEVLNAYTPANAEVLTIRLKIAQVG